MPFSPFRKALMALWSCFRKYNPADRLEMKMHARADAETSSSWPEEIFKILQRFEVRQVPYVPDAGH
jgi:hypothetical protein